MRIVVVHSLLFFFLRSLASLSPRLVLPQKDAPTPLLPRSSKGPGGGSGPAAPRRRQQGCCCCEGDEDDDDKDDDDDDCSPQATAGSGGGNEGAEPLRGRLVLARVRPGGCRARLGSVSELSVHAPFAAAGRRGSPRRRKRRKRGSWSGGEGRRRRRRRRNRRRHHSLLRRRRAEARGVPRGDREVEAAGRIRGGDLRAAEMDGRERKESEAGIVFFLTKETETKNLEKKNSNSSPPRPRRPRPSRASSSTPSSARSATAPPTRCSAA